MVSVSLLVATSQRRVVCIADEPDRHVSLVPHVVECLPDLSAEAFGNRTVLVLVPQWHDKVPDAHAWRLAFLESHLADVLLPTHLNTLDVIGSIRVYRPFPELLVAGKMPLDRLARPGRFERTGGHVDLTGIGRIGSRVKWAGNRVERTIKRTGGRVDLTGGRGGGHHQESENQR